MLETQKLPNRNNLSSFLCKSYNSKGGVTHAAR
jgi:hypothetical protein